MEVVKTNVDEMLLKFEQALQDASFVAIDLEFTGLREEEGKRMSRFDSPAMRYLAGRNSVSKFAPLQLGLCVFTEKEGGEFQARPFNIFTFQQPLANSREPDKRFLCQSSSLAFLGSHNFDFNKLFNQGVSYLSLAEEASMRADFAARQERKVAPRNHVKPTRPNDVKYDLSHTSLKQC